MRGIMLALPNQYGFFLKEILELFDLSDETCLVLESEIVDGRDSRRDICVDGKYDYEELLKEISAAESYIVQVNVQVFPKGEQADAVEDYESFLASKCKAVILVSDTTCAELYFKEEYIPKIRQKREKIMEQWGYYSEITDENDGRYAFSVW